MASELSGGVGVAGPVTRGIVLMVVGVGLLTAMDGFMKALTMRLPVAEAMFFRCVVALPILLVPLCAEGGARRLMNAQRPVQVLRGVLAFLTGFTFFTAVSQMPLADALVIGFAAPFLVAAFAGPFLGERVSRMQWFSIALGFMGVLVVVRPGPGFFDGGAVWAVAAALFYAANTLVLRRLGRTDEALVTTIWGTIVPALLYALVMLPGLVWPTLAELPFILAVGVLGAAGTFTVNAAFRLAPAATLSSLEYTALLWAVLIGVFAFDDVPGWEIAFGSLLIIASGVALARVRG